MSFLRRKKAEIKYFSSRLEAFQHEVEREPFFATGNKFVCLIEEVAGPTPFQTVSLKLPLKKDAYHIESHDGSILDIKQGDLVLFYIQQCDNFNDFKLSGEITEVLLPVLIDGSRWIADKDRLLKR